jgi:hypothetical protein
MNILPFFRSCLFRFTALSLFGAALLAGAQPADIRQGLVAYWPLDFTDGATTPDVTPFGNHLNLISMGVGNFIPGRYGNAATFDGASQMLSRIYTFGEDNGLPVYRARRYTVAMWVKGLGSQPQDRRVFAEGSTTNTNPLLTIGTDSLNSPLRTNVVDMFIRTDPPVVTPLNHGKSTNMAFDGNWHHIAWVEDNGVGRLYIDGLPDPAVLNHVPGSLTMNTISLGGIQRATTGSYFAGMIDDAVVWERPLTQAEIQDVMNNSLNPAVPQFAPYVVTQPASATRGLGERHTFRVQATGTRPLSYQWYSGDTEIVGATSNILTLSNLSAGQAGNYTVRVTNPVGSVTSLVAVLTIAPDPASDLRNGLVSHWPMETVDGDPGAYTTEDLYSHNTMRLVTTSFFDQAIGAFGNAIVFNGLEQYGVRMGGFPIYNNPALTLSIWVNAGPQADRRFFCESTTNNNNNPLFAFGSHASDTNPAIRVFIRNSTGGVLVDRVSTRPVLDGNWHHVVWVETNGQAKLYIDGVLDETDFNYTRGSLTLDQTTVAAILRTSAASFFTGALDEVALWNRMLTFTEIQELHTAGVPPPIMPNPPEITLQPVSQSLLTGSKVTFSSLATGASPLDAQWRKDGTPLPGETNFTLMFTNIALGHAGNYDVIVTNPFGQATSQVATLTVTLRPPPPTVLKIDFNNTNAPSSETEPGFFEFTIGPFINPGITGPILTTFGGVDVTLTAVGTTMESRKRATPVNGGDFTQERLLQDFVFTRDTATDQGLDIMVEFMETNRPYAVNIWSFDTGSSAGDRVSDWFANGAMVQTAWTFNGANLPTSDNQYRFSFNTTSDDSGRILIQGRRSTAATVGLNVFINALEIRRRELAIQTIELSGPDAIRIVFEALDVSDIHRVDRRADLAQDWAEVQDAFFQPPNGNTVEVIIPTHGAPAGFYRVVQVP